MNTAKVEGVIRHGMTYIGGITTAIPVISLFNPAIGATVTTGTQAVLAILGGVATLAGLIWSVKAPEKKDV